MTYVWEQSHMAREIRLHIGFRCIMNQVMFYLVTVTVHTQVAQDSKG